MQTRSWWQPGGRQTLSFIRGARLGMGAGREGMIAAVAGEDKGALDLWKRPWRLPLTTNEAETIGVIR